MLFFGSPFGQAETRVTGPTSTKLVQTHKTDAGTVTRSAMVFIAFTVLKTTQTAMAIAASRC